MRIITHICIVTSREFPCPSQQSHCLRTNLLDCIVQYSCVKGVSTFGNAGPVLLTFNDDSTMNIVKLHHRILVTATHHLVAKNEHDPRPSTTLRLEYRRTSIFEDSHHEHVRRFVLVSLCTTAISPRCCKCFRNLRIRGCSALVCTCSRFHLGTHCGSVAHQVIRPVFLRPPITRTLSYQ